MRYAAAPDGVLGVLLSGNRHLCMTLERPWEWNQDPGSCIPSGAYRCVWDEAGQVYVVQNVPGRSGILVGMGNNPYDAMGGHILLGTTFGTGLLPPFLLESPRAFQALVYACDGATEFGLCINDTMGLDTRWASPWYGRA